MTKVSTDVNGERKPPRKRRLLGEGGQAECGEKERRLDLRHISLALPF
jgi:hypothetical protein